MNKKTLKAIENLKNNRGLAEALLQSGDGARLVEMLSVADGGTALTQATEKAARGDSSELTAMLSEMLTSPEGAKLMQRLHDAMQL